MQENRIGQPLRLLDLDKYFGSIRAADKVNLDVGPGEFITLLGPSGSGKTTVLLSIAGFLEPTNGDILLGGRSIVDLPAYKRNIGMVFQRYALFPHMTVEQNVAFPLRMRGWTTEQKREAVNETLQKVQLEHLSSRMPGQLSGGQQQRVALARAIVFSPPLLLMDEPLGALDKKLRETLQFEIKALQKNLGITVLFVTHDQGEALAMSDRIAVMNGGRIEQIGTPEDLYSYPRTQFVADFIGDSNFLKGVVESVEEGTSYACVNIEGSPIRARVDHSQIKNLRVGDTAKLMIRPENIQVDEPTGPKAIVRGSISAASFAGSHKNAIVSCAGDNILLRLSLLSNAIAQSVEVGDQIGLYWEPEHAAIFPMERGDQQ